MTLQNRYLRFSGACHYDVIWLGSLKILHIKTTDVKARYTESANVLNRYIYMVPKGARIQQIRLTLYPLDKMAADDIFRCIFYEWNIFDFD